MESGAKRGGKAKTGEGERDSVKDERAARARPEAEAPAGTGAAAAGVLALRGGARPQRRKPVAGRWTAAKQRAFLAHLAATCNVTRSARAVGMHESSVYPLRTRCAAFRAGWDAALDEGYAKLELVALERAINGSQRRIMRANGVVDRFRDYPDRLVLHLLKAHRDRPRPASATTIPEDEAEAARQRILKKLAALERREAAKRKKS